MDQKTDEPRPSEGIREGDSTLFAFQGRMITVIVKSIGWDRLRLISADFIYVFDEVPVSIWRNQKALIDAHHAGQTPA